MKTGVTAASGSLGALLLDRLAELQGAANVVAIARATEKIARQDIETRTGDYTDPTDWPTALAGLDTVVLVSSPEGPWDRVQMHRNVIAGAQQAGVRKLLYTSVIGNGKEAATDYAPVAAVNRQAEQDLMDSGLTWAIPRNGLYLEFDVAHIVAAAGTGGVFRNPGGAGRCGYITRAEIALATAQLAVHDKFNSGIYNLVGDCHTQAELVAMVNEAYGLDVRYQQIDDADCYAQLLPKRGAEVATMLTGCYQCIRSGAYDVDSHFEAVTGRPARSLPEQINDLRSTHNP